MDLLLQLTMNPELEKQYKEMGEKWLRGEIEVLEWELGEKKIKLSESQREFLNSKARFNLICGGFGSGKTLILILKMILFSLWFPDNRILLGRRTRAELEKVTLPDFFDLCPSNLVEYRVQQGIIRFFNRSEIILFGLDALQSETEDSKKAEQELKSLNLGAVFIDQLEEVEEKIWLALRGRLRRRVAFRQMNATTNPADFWAYDFWKGNPREGTKYWEVSMLENKDNLPEDYVLDLLSNPSKAWIDRYVHGIWSRWAPEEKLVFPIEYLEEQEFNVRKPVRTTEGIKIFKEKENNHSYQIGCDPSEGRVDPCFISVVDKDTGEQVATFSGFVPTPAIKDKLLILAKEYETSTHPQIIPEANAGGLALIELLKLDYPYIYASKSHGQLEEREHSRLGFMTNVRTKALLVENFRHLLRKKFPRIRDKEVLNELRSFVYTDEVRQKGYGASGGAHDDRVMGTMLSYLGLEPLTRRETSILERLEAKEKNKRINYQLI